MHADRHHLRRLAPLFVQHVKAIFEVGIKLLRGIEALRGGKTHVVGIEGIGHDQVRPARTVGARHLDPKRQIVAVVVAVVIKAAVLNHQPASVGAVAPGVPAGGRPAEEIG